tara:strand:+ start:131 stop:340 length:210 start_codon:yes stop_codon:yes gene_type:complete
MTMRRPPLTRKKIDLIWSAICDAWLMARDSDDTEPNIESRKEIKEAMNFVQKLSQWHTWKQEQKKELEG